MLLSAPAAVVGNNDGLPVLAPNDNGRTPLPPSPTAFLPPPKAVLPIDGLGTLRGAPPTFVFAPVFVFKRVLALVPVVNAVLAVVPPPSKPALPVVVIMGFVGAAGFGFGFGARVVLLLVLV